MSFLSWIVVGAVAGWFANTLMGEGKKNGCFFNILLGIVGAFIGGYVFNYFGETGVTGLNFWSIFVSTTGAVILLFVVNLFSSKK